MRKLRRQPCPPTFSSTMNTWKDGNTARKQRSCYFSVVPSPATRTTWMIYLTSKAILISSFHPFPSSLSGWTRLKSSPPGSTALRKTCWSEPSWALQSKPWASLHAFPCPIHQVAMPSCCFRSRFSPSTHQDFSEGLLDILSVQRHRKYHLGCKENCSQPKIWMKKLVKLI